MHRACSDHSAAAGKQRRKRFHRSIDLQPSRDVLCVCVQLILLCHGRFFGGVVQKKGSPMDKSGKVASIFFQAIILSFRSRLIRFKLKFVAATPPQPCRNVAVASQTLQVVPLDTASSLLMALEGQAESSGGERAHAAHFAAQKLSAAPPAAARAGVTSLPGSNIGERRGARSTRLLLPLASPGC